MQKGTNDEPTNEEGSSDGRELIRKEHCAVFEKVMRENLDVQTMRPPGEGSNGTLAFESHDLVVWWEVMTTDDGMLTCQPRDQFNGWATIRPVRALQREVEGALRAYRNEWGKSR